jgi:hypothetical protein
MKNLITDSVAYPTQSSINDCLLKNIIPTVKSFH